MSETEEYDEKIYNIVLDIQKKLDEMADKINGLTDKPRFNKPNVDRDSTYENKRNVYLTKLNTGEILYPKQSTLEYYKIKYDAKTQNYS